MIIDPARLNDLKQLLAIEEASFGLPWTEASFLSELRKDPPSLYVIRETPLGHLLGFICFWLVADEIQVMNLAVHPDHRRQGLGRQLIYFLFQKQAEQKIFKIFLEVRASNEAALALYHSLGFRTLYRRSQYYMPEKEDALVMEWSG